MNSAIAVAIGLTLAIILILKKCHPVYALILGAVVSGLMSGWGFDLTIKEMFSGVRDISPAIVRILAAGVLTGVLVKTGAADKIALTIVEKADGAMFSLHWPCLYLSSPVWAYLSTWLSSLWLRSL